MLKKAGFRGRLPRVVACGRRKAAFDRFENALRNGDECPILLVDSEEVVEPNANPSGAWLHLNQTDHWQRPPGANDDQAQLMVTTMETWLLADREAVIAYFPRMNANTLPPPDSDLESISNVKDKLKNATRRSPKGRYHEGNHSFDLLGQVDPGELRRRLPHFRRFVEALKARL